MPVVAMVAEQFVLEPTVADQFVFEPMVADQFVLEPTFELEPMMSQCLSQ